MENIAIINFMDELKEIDIEYSEVPPTCLIILINIGLIVLAIILLVVYL